MIKVSCVIPVLDSHEVLRRQLLHFERMGLPEDTELIVIDDGSDPPLENTSSLQVTIHRTYDKRPWTWALARNSGACMARGEYLLMFDLDHIISRPLLDFVRAFDGLKVQFIREFGVLDEAGTLTQDRKTLVEYGWRGGSIRVGPLPNNFAMRRDLFWELGGYREDLVEKSYPQGEDRAFRSKWRTYQQETGAEVCSHRPVMYVFPTGKWCGDVDYNPMGLFHNLSRKTSRNFWYQQQRKRQGVTS
jgi:glycosyltransferase involved in cell wall biosynthesis